MGSWPNQLFRWLAHGIYRASPTAVADGATVELLTDAYGRLETVFTTSAPAGVTPVRQLTAANLGTLKSAGAGKLIEVTLWSSATVPLWFQIHDKASAVSGGDTCVDQVMVPAGGSIGWRPLVPVSATAQLRWAASTTPATYTAPGTPAMGFSGAVL